MSRWVRVLWLVGFGLVLASPVHAQASSDPDQARFRFRSFSFSPALRVTDLGWDSNVFNDTDTEARRSDTTAALSPLLQGWVRSPRVTADLRGQWDYYYFRQLTSLRALDADQSARVEVRLNRVTPFVSGSLVTTRHRQHLEIDAIAERRYDDLQAGAYVRLTAKTSVGVFGGRSHIKYENGSLFRDVDLARSLNHTGTRAGLGVRYAITPLTTFNVDVLRGNDRFEFLPGRNAESFWVTPSVEFKPFALISGRASYGFRRVTFSDPTQPPFKSTVASVDLQYLFRNRTQFSVGVRRDLEYSYLLEQRDYLATDLSTTVSHRFGERWELVGTVGRYKLGYRRRDANSGLADSPSETIINYRAGIGYYVGRNRLAVDAYQWNRDADATARGYGRTRIMSSFSYAF